MAVDFSTLSGTDFALGAFGATFVEIFRLKRLLDKNRGQLRGSSLQLFFNVVWFLLFISGSGLLAALQGVSPLLSAFCTGLTAPVFFSVIFRDNAEAERELVDETKRAVLAQADTEKQKAKAKYQKVIAAKDKEIEALKEAVNKILLQGKSSQQGSQVFREVVENVTAVNESSMVQNNEGNSRGWQTRVEDDTAYPSEVSTNTITKNTTNRYVEFIQDFAPFFVALMSFWVSVALKTKTPPVEKIFFYY